MSNVGVEPNDAEILAGTDAGSGAQAAHAIAAQDERERMPIARGSDALSQTPHELEDPRDLRQRLIDRRHAHDTRLPSRRRQTLAEALVGRQHAGTEPHAHVRQPTVIRPRDDIELGHRCQSICVPLLL